MPDENIADSQTGNVTNLPPESAEAPSSATTDAEGGSASVAKEASSAPNDAPRIEENRSESRIHVRWHLDAFVEGHGVHHGFVKDVSLKGADIFLEHNLQNVKLVKLHIYVPPLNSTSVHHVIEVSAKIVYVTHDNQEHLFRTGIIFLKFSIESEQAYLQSRITKH